MAIYVPSFWDYLAQGIAGIPQSFMAMEEFKTRREGEKRAQAAEARAKELHELTTGPQKMQRDIVQAEASAPQQFLPSLLNPGGMSPLGPIPTKTYSESQYQYAGVESPRARTRRYNREGTQDLSAQLEIPAKQYEAAKATQGIKTVESDAAVARMKDLKDVVNQYSDAFVAKEILATGKLTSKSNLSGIAAKAYADFISDPQRAQTLGATGVSQETLRPLFDKAVKEAWDAQQVLDNDALRARAYRDNMMGRQDKTTQLMNAMTGITTRVQTELKKLSDPLAMMSELMTIPPAQQAAAQASFLARKQGLESVLNNLLSANIGIAAGKVNTDQLEQLLSDAMLKLDGPEGAVTPQATQKYPDEGLINALSAFPPTVWRRELDTWVRSGQIDPAQRDRVLQSLESRRNRK